ncbi:DUF2267 domain-containing protein [Halopiger aswanensis]|uniref:Uncharacterized protein (DUF2267 family) n=1 Tax=Halopiger aswanensis TaxID=148449 RepID=A0A3R7DY01_9EURY|nr:DUF2267 domain-containing protein [Halopiger aswanensis]RKD93569.1 uncharacterized protein (DUF2267 family) [Halopiger aswanensis]
MERHDFYGSVQYEANLADEADARDATQAVLSALGERLDETRLQRIDGELPAEIGDHLVEGASGRRLDYDGFLERITERADRADTSEPEVLAQAVVGTMLEHISDEEAEGLRERLEELEFGAAIPETGPGARS